jgi:hypothetical protein
MDQASTGSEPDLKTPMPVVELARLKVRGVTFLCESLYDDAKGIVNIAWEKEIRKLTNEPSIG